MISLCFFARYPEVPLSSECTHLLAVNTPLVRLDDDETLARNVQTGALDLLHAVGTGVLVGADNFLHFLGRDGEAGGRGPDAVAGIVEDGGLVEVASADEAEREMLVCDGWRGC